MDRSKAREYMELALELAAKAAGRTYPNPMVGCVIVSSGKIAGKGYHKRAGMPHAEVAAIRSAGKKCSGASMFVTLEPCDHYGRTPPCTKAIIESGISEVYAAMKDPNPLNSGRGLRTLRKAGIKVHCGVMREEAAYMNRKYTRFITGGRPYMTLKLAQSLDGKIAASDGTSKWISSRVSRASVKKMRSSFDAVMTGINTVMKDDPCLFGPLKKGYNTARVIVDSRARISLRSNIIKTADVSPVIIGTTEHAPGKKVRSLRAVRGVEIVAVKSSGGRVDLGSFLKELAARGMVNVLVEGGAELAGSLLDAGFIDEVIFFIAPKILGGGMTSVRGKGAPSIGGAVMLDNVEVETSGGDVLVKGIIRR
jgi:diaminohydroxyphosphoribosylaminopyrimidine deaminase / 5-amino-6-(5-phosphoribosylamino)uracil reductase